MRIDRTIAVVVALAFIGCSTGTQESNQTELKGAMTDLEPGSAAIQMVGITDGSGVTTGQMVKLKIKGIENVPAGEVENGSGHVHILFNKEYVEKGVVIGEKTEYRQICLNGEPAFTLPEIEKKFLLTAQLVDGEHRSYGQELSHVVKVVSEDLTDSPKTQ